MRHQVYGRKLNRDTNQRKALFRGLVVSLIEKGRIKTTQAKAKAIKGWVDKLVTIAKKEDAHHYRLLIKELANKEACAKLHSELTPLFKERSSGFTKMIKLGVRQGDDAMEVILEWVDKPKPKAEVSKPEMKKLDKTKK